MQSFKTRLAVFLSHFHFSPYLMLSASLPYVPLVLVSFSPLFLKPVSPFHNISTQSSTSRGHYYQDLAWKSEEEVYFLRLDRLEGKIAWGVLGQHGIKESLFEGILWAMSAHLDVKEVEGEEAVMEQGKLLGES